jgi:hypothetical protein
MRQKPRQEPGLEILKPSHASAFPPISKMDDLTTRTAANGSFGFEARDSVQEKAPQIVPTAMLNVPYGDSQSAQISMKTLLPHGRRLGHQAVTGVAAH